MWFNHSFASGSQHIEWLLRETANICQVENPASSILVTVHKN